MRRAVQKQALDIFSDLPRSTTPLPNTLFLGMNDANRSRVVKQAIRKRVIFQETDEFRVEWVSGPCGCIRRLHEDVEKADLIQVTDHMYNYHWCNVCERCQGKYIMLQVAETSYTSRANFPWWLTMLQGINKIPKWAGA